MAESSAGLQRLAPFVMGRARRGVVGSSRYAQRLRTAVLEAARDPQRQPVLISGEPGLEKDNLAPWCTTDQRTGVVCLCDWTPVICRAAASTC